MLIISFKFYLFTCLILPQLCLDLVLHNWKVFRHQERNPSVWHLLLQISWTTFNQELSPTTIGHRWKPIHECFHSSPLYFYQNVLLHILLKPILVGNNYHFMFFHNEKQPMLVDTHISKYLILPILYHISNLFIYCTIQF